MSLELYDDRVIFDLYDAETKEIVQDYEFDDERPMGLGNRSHIKQLRAAVSHWCPVCECAFRKEDMAEVGSLCPICGAELEDFDLESVLGEVSMDFEDNE